MIESKEVRQSLREMRTLALRIDKQNAVERETVAELGHLASIIPMILFLREVGGPILQINDHGLWVLGYQRGEIVGKTERELWGEEVALKSLREDQQVVASRSQVLGIVDHWVCPKAGRRILLTSKVPVLENSDPVRRILVASQDISDLLPTICSLAIQDGRCLARGLGVLQMGDPEGR